MKVLTIGSSPPPIDGQSLAFKSAVKALKLSHDILEVQTSFRSNNFVHSVFLVFVYIFKVLKSKIVFRPDVIYFVCSRTLIGSIRDLLLLIVYRKSKSLIILPLLITLLDIKDPNQNFSKS